MATARRGAGLRAHLLSGGFLVLLPVLAFAGLVVREHVRAEHARVEAEARGLVRAMAGAVDREVAEAIAALRALATSPALAAGDLAAFHRQAEAAARDRGGAVNLRGGADGATLLLSTTTPFGAPLPPTGLSGGPPTVTPADGAAENRAPEAAAVSGLYRGAVTGRPRLRVTVAAPPPGCSQGAGDAPCLLDLSFGPERVLAALGAAEAPAGWVAVAADRAGVILARHPGNDGFAGRPLPGFEQLRGREGVWRGVSVAGAPIAGFYRRTDLTGWLVGLSVPEAVLDAPLRRSLAWLAVAGAALLAPAVALPLLVARRVGRDVRALSAAAVGLGAGGEVAPPATGIRELRAIGSAMAAAAAQLRDRSEGERAAVAAARRERELLRSVVEGTADAVAVKDLEGRYVLANAAAAALLGRPAAGLLGRTMGEVLPGAAAALAEACGRVAAEGRPLALEHALADPDGGPSRDLIFAMAPWRDPSGGAVIGVICVAHDITERRRAEERAREAERALQRLARRSAVGAMASGLAHELNQPLGAVTMWLRGAGRLLAPQAPADGGAPSEERLARAREALDRAAAQAMRAGEIVRRLRDFVGRGETERRPEPVGPAVREAAALALAGAAGEGVEMACVMDDAALGEAVMDRVQVQQVVVNLVRNAAEAVRGRPRREVRVCAGRVPGARPGEGAVVEVAVADTGLGIAPEVAPRLFESFVSTKEDGMGIGLSICRTIVEAHGGRLWAAPAPEGEGTVFRFTLPVEAADAAPRLEEEPAGA